MCWEPIWFETSRLFPSYLHKVVNSLHVVQIVVVHIHAETKEEPSVPAINNFECTKLNRDQLKNSKYLVSKELNQTSTKFVCVWFRTETIAWTSSINFCFSSSSKVMYLIEWLHPEPCKEQKPNNGTKTTNDISNHFARRVFPARFWISIKRICKSMSSPFSNDWSPSWLSLVEYKIP